MSDILPLEALYKASENDFNEFIPVDDSAIDSYFQNLDQVDDLQSGPGQNKGGKTVQKHKRRRVRSERQQMLNKLAQLRYRERKRQRQANMEEKVKQLGSKVDNLEELDNQIQQLEVQNAELEKQLRDREAAIQGAKESQPHVKSEGSSKLKDPAAKKSELDGLVQRWLATVDDIRQLYYMLDMDSQGALSGAVLKNCDDFSFLPPAQQRMMLNVNARVDKLVETVNNLCLQVLRLDGLSIEAIMNANFERCKTLAGWKDERKWLAAAHNLNLTPHQQQNILQVRSQMLQRLAGIYSERHALNQEAVRGLMDNSEAHDSDSRQLIEVLSRLEENLKAEQRAVSEQEFVTFKHLLTPLQAGLFILKAFPDHCDCMALFNAVHQVSRQGS